MYTPGDDLSAVVADIGSFSTRIGFAGDDTPRAYFPSVVGTIQGTSDVGVGSSKEHFFDVAKYRDNMSIDSFVKDGLISDWNLLENVWEHAFNTYLKIETNESPVLLAEKPYNPPNLRRRMTELMFEKYNVPAMFMSKDAVLSCFACGRTSGLTIDMGGSGTLITPVYDGWVDTKGLNRSVVGGRVLDAHFITLLTQLQNGNQIRPLFRINKSVSSDGMTIVIKQKDLPLVHPSYDSFMQLEIGRDAKESVCRLADTPVSESELKFSSVPTSLYELPDGTILDLGIDRFRVPELLMDSSALELDYPDLIGLGMSINQSLSSSLNSDSKLKSGPVSILPHYSKENIPNLIVDSTLRCDAEIQSTLLANLVITGGSSCFDGISERLKFEVDKIMQPISPGWRVKTMAAGTSERPICAWLGGSILASLGSFNEMWVSRAEYDEYGAALIDRKCP